MEPVWILTMALLLSMEKTGTLILVSPRKLCYSLFISYFDLEWWEHLKLDFLIFRVPCG